MEAHPEEKVLILDFGAQYGHLIARRVRELNVYCEVLPYHTPASQVAKLRPRGIIFTGGPKSVYGDGAPRIDPAIFELGIPIFGICYGMQVMSYQLGGDVRRAERAEYGKADLLVSHREPLFHDLPEEMPVWMSHGDLVLEAPPGFRVLASTENTPLAAIGDEERKFYGVQFHPEVAHTPMGTRILANFLFEICGLEPSWTMSSYAEDEIEKIRRQVGEHSVIAGLSGGVDSAVATLLVHRAVGDHLTAIFVDHGLLREGEAEEVIRVFTEDFHVPLRHVDASQRFLTRLKGITDPEQKRKVIGEEFIRVFEEEARKVGDARFLVQGTLYPDIIESGFGGAQVIKSHHNVGGLPERMDLELIEPLRELFKDEVRRLGRELGLPESICERQPFPGPGLAVRVTGEVTPEKLAVLRPADRIVREEIEAAGLSRRIWQYFAVLPDVQTVGVLGDERSYAYPVVVRAVTSEDGMTADWARIPYETLEKIAARIVNEVEHVNRVVYDITSKPPGTIEWE